MKGGRSAVRLAALGAVVCGLAWGVPQGLKWARHRAAEASGPAATAQATELKPLAAAAGIAWPPKRFRLVAFKQERELEVWVGGENGTWTHLTTYPILAASGKLGPKRREGDKQVPEGLYALTTLNPQSAYHLSIKLDYPNATDIANSKVPRKDIGSDIYLHGSNVSIGCIAIGDKPIEQVFAMAKEVPQGKRDILVCPVDFRKQPGFRIPKEAAWVGEMYAELEKQLREMPRLKR
ncbi:MAG: L,D-transpeptidase family protein [Armatimonadetes bacterium]|nr:L,D-transpeptidase family protein [Armatimonadota bacterium]